jgi:hypothetical protein
MRPMLIEQKEFELELSDTWQRFARDDAYEWRRDDGRQLIINSYTLTADAKPVTVVDRFADILRDAHRETFPRCALDDVASEIHTERVVRTFGGTSRDGIGFFAGVVMSTEPVVGSHVLLTFSYTGGKRAEGEDLFRELRFMPRLDAIRRVIATEGAAPDLARVYPYIVPASYLEDRSLDAVRELGHGLVLLFAEDCDGVCRVLANSDLVKAGLEIPAVLDRALANLDALLKSRAIPMRLFEPAGARMIRIGDHWLAAACMLVPDICNFLLRTLGVETAHVAIPQRDVLLCFTADSPATRDEVLHVIREEHAEGRKPLTEELFYLDARGVRPV